MESECTQILRVYKEVWVRMRGRMSVPVLECMWVTMPVMMDDAWWLMMTDCWLEIDTWCLMVDVGELYARCAVLLWKWIDDRWMMIDGDLLAVMWLMRHLMVMDTQWNIVDCWDNREIVDVDRYWQILMWCVKINDLMDGIDGWIDVTRKWANKQE